MPDRHYALRAAANPDGRTCPRRFAPSSAKYRPRLAGVAVWGWVDVCGSHSHPLDADRDWWQTLEHLSPWRGIWCGIQLNTMRAHGIPSELSVSCVRCRRPVFEHPRRTWKRSPGEVPGTLLPPLRGIGIGKMDRGPGCDRRRPGGLQDMRYPLRHRLNRPMTNPRPAARRSYRCPGTYFNQAILTSPHTSAATAVPERPPRAAPGRCAARSGPRRPAIAWPPSRQRPVVLPGHRTAAPAGSPGSPARPRLGLRDSG
jgi:hypothetical protein